MDLSNYINVINDVVKKIENSEIDSEGVSLYLKDAYGWETNNNVSEGNFDKFKQEYLKEKAKAQFNKDTYVIKKNILDIISSINEIERYTNPFTIRYNSKKLANLFEENDKYKELPEYKKVLNETVRFIENSRGDLIFTKEHYKILK